MMKTAFLPFVRRRRIWAAAMGALFVFLLSGALLSRAVSESREQLNRAYDEMEIEFRLGPGRRRFGNTFSLTLYQLRELVTADWMEDLNARYEMTQTIYLNGPPPDYPIIPKTVDFVWVSDPAAVYGNPSSGEYGDGLYLSPSLRDEFGIRLYDNVPITWNVVSRSAMNEGQYWRKYTVLCAVSPEIPDNTVVFSWESFDRYMRDRPDLKANLFFGEMTFRVKKECRRDIRDIADFVQRTVNNTDHPANRNRDVAVYYNEAEIDAVMAPLEDKQASALFFEKLFRILLPAAAHVLETAAALSLANECGGRRLLGESAPRVFVSLWTPAAVLLSGCYLLILPVLGALGLLRDLSPGPFLLNWAASLGLTALTLALLCILNPLTVLKERSDEL